MTTNNNRRTVKKEDYTQLRDGRWFDKGLATKLLEVESPNKPGAKDTIWKTPGGTIVGHFYVLVQDQRDSFIEEVWTVLNPTQVAHYAKQLAAIPIEYLDPTKEIK